MKRTLLAVSLSVLSVLATSASFAQATIKIGEINSYSLLPAFTEPYRKGWQLALEEVNAAGGINGKKLVVVSRTTAASPPTPPPPPTNWCRARRW